MIGKKMFTPEIEERFSEWITDNLKDMDLTSNSKLDLMQNKHL